MVEKTEEKPSEKKIPEPEKGTPEEETGEIPEEKAGEEGLEPTAEALEKTSALLSPEGVVMLSLAGFLDLLGIICAILILALGTGIVLKKILDVIGFTIIGLLWPLFRYGAIPEEGVEKVKEKITKKRAATKKMAEKTIMNFLKKHGFKFLGELIPIIGDFLPLWTWTVYSELTH